MVGKQGLRPIKAFFANITGKSVGQKVVIFADYGVTGRFIDQKPSSPLS